MSYIGQTLPADTFQGFVTDKFTGDGTANKTFTLSKTPFNESAILVTIDGVVQEATDDFTVSGTTLTLVGTAPNNSEVNAIHIGGALPIGQAASLDLNGASDQLILDADADTTISADTDDQIDFKTGGTDRLKVQSTSGNNVVVADGLTLTDGNITFGGSGGHGIDFAVTSDGTTMSSELLDDYEEGDCTLGFTTSSGAMTMHGTYKYGKYTKVGNLVTLTGYAIGAALGSATSTQGLTMTGLPFSVIGENGAYSSMNVSYGENLNITAGYHIGGYARINYATVPLLIWDSTAGTTALLQSELSNNGGFIFSIMYYVS